MRLTYERYQGAWLCRADYRGQFGTHLSANRRVASLLAIAWVLYYLGDTARFDSLTEVTA